MNDDQEALEELEEELKEETLEEDVANHKVSGHSVFEIERIIKDKSDNEKEQTI